MGQHIFHQPQLLLGRNAEELHDHVAGARSQQLDMFGNDQVQGQLQDLVVIQNVLGIDADGDTIESHRMANRGNTIFKGNHFRDHPITALDHTRRDLTGIGGMGTTDTGKVAHDPISSLEKENQVKKTKYNRRLYNDLII